MLIFGYASAQKQQDRQADSGARKIVFIAGPDSHGKGEHEHNGGSTLLAKALNDSLPGVHAVVVHNGWPENPAELRDADAVVLYGDGGGDHMVIPHLAELDNILKKGAGLVVLHFALEVPKGEAGNYFLNWIGGFFEIDWSVNPVWEAGFSTFPDHPVANGIKPFSITDEWYYHLRFAENMKSITPILQALPPESTLNRPDGTHSNNAFVRESVINKKEPQTVAWAFDRPDGGRGFGFSGGHIHKNWQNDNFRKLVLNAIAWTAKIKVPENGVPSATPTQNELDDLSKKVN
ncbi:ThuA domain-containing protein [Dyadobacter flavalbus]|uniref:ThuA domain-containing protein n=2 Tax=Dyadobacter flavalbus TaxID=2579942 RepID=A0A5M8R593_9BACT|nr:ThuA domain-containing protein [Dyadobacter flavalbus]